MNPSHAVVKQSGPLQGRSGTGPCSSLTQTCKVSHTCRQLGYKLLAPAASCFSSSLTGSTPFSVGRPACSSFPFASQRYHASQALSAVGASEASSLGSSFRRDSLQKSSAEVHDRQPDDWRRELIVALAEAEGFAEMTVRAKVATAQPWHTITVRPIALRGSRHLQVTTFTARQSTSANHPGPAGDVAATEAAVGPLLAAGGLGSVSLRTAKQDLAVQITKRGKGIVHRTAPQSRPALVSVDPGRQLSHDRAKDTPIPADQPHPFLQKIGFQTPDGRIKAHMQDKFSQVNEFLKLLGHTGIVRDLAAASQGGDGRASSSTSTSGSTSGSSTGAESRRPLHILDCGCGSSHLSFGTYHYLNHVLGVPASLGGVDVNAGLMARANDNAAQLGLQGVRFDTAPIGDYRPPVRPDIVLALHACDTATDDSLALAVKQCSPLIMAVPCCHAHLHKQLSGRSPSCRPPWAPLLRHGILKQRQLDLLTDTLRAQLLRIAGYRTDVVEFVSTEHTPRNLLIRAVRRDSNNSNGSQGSGAAQAQDEAEASASASAVDGGGGAGAQRRWSRQQLAAAREYLALRDYWQVVPRLEELLAAELGPLLREAAARSPGAAGGGGASDDDGVV